MLLLEYTSNPIRYEIQTTPASLQLNQELPTHTVTKSGGELTQQTQHAQMRQDSYERRASMGFRGISAQTQYMKQAGRSAALAAIRSYADMGNSVRDINKGANIPDAYYNKMMQEHLSGELGFTSIAPVNISWQEGALKQQYEAARVAFDWKTDKGKANFVPGSFKMNITQYPSMSFKYTGGFNYVPRSADPNYNKAI
ncbi:MAG: DUF6470 family protein [Oscillospiraceae bacterium]